MQYPWCHIDSMVFFCAVEASQSHHLQFGHEHMRSSSQDVLNELRYDIDALNMEHEYTSTGPFQRNNGDDVIPNDRC